MRIVRRQALLIGFCTVAGLLQWVFVKLVAIRLTAAEFGGFVTALSLALVFTLPLAALQSGLSRRVAALLASGRDAEIPGEVRRLAGRVLPAIGLPAAALILFAGPLGRALFVPAASIRVVVGILLGFALLQISLGVLVGRERFAGFVSLLVLDGVLRCGLLVLLPSRLVGATPALLTALVAIAGAGALGLVLIRHDLGGGAGARAKDRAGVAPFLVGAMLVYAFAFGDVLLVRLVLEGPAAARYAAAAAIGRLMLAIPLPVLPSFVPLVARLGVEGRPTRRVLFHHLWIVLMPMLIAVAFGLFDPGLVGAVILDRAKQGNLGLLVPLALFTGGLNAMTLLVLHYALARGRAGIIGLVATALPLQVGLVLLLPAHPVVISFGVSMLALGLFVAGAGPVFRRGAALALLLLLVGCRTSPNPPPAGSPREAADRAISVLTGPKSFSADVLVTIETKDGRRTLRGALAVRRPGRLRMQVSGALGITVADVAVVGKRATLLLPREQRAIVTKVGDHADEPGPIRLAARLLDEFELSALEVRVDLPKDGQEGRLRFLRGGRVVSRVAYDPVTGLPRSRESDGSVVHYSHFHRTGEQWWPGRVRIESGGTRIEVEILDLEPDPGFGDDLFELSVPAGYATGER